MTLIRPERGEDAGAIRDLVAQAFERAPHGSGTEAAIVDALREADALSVSLVAEDAGVIVGHAAFSPVTVGAEAAGWFGLGPVAVRPDRQRSGIGRRLIQEGLDRLRSAGAEGCVVLGDPGYYARFGFEADPGLRYGDVPPEYFQRLVFRGGRPTGDVRYHPAFGAA